MLAHAWHVHELYCTHVGLEKLILLGKLPQRLAFSFHVNMLLIICRFEIFFPKVTINVLLPNILIYLLADKYVVYQTYLSA